MSVAIEWIYPRRDPFSWSLAACLGGFVVWVMIQPTAIAPRSEREFLALLEELSSPPPAKVPAPPPPPVVSEVTAPPPPQPPPTAQHISVTSPAVPPPMAPPQKISDPVRTSRPPHPASVSTPAESAPPSALSEAKPADNAIPIREPATADLKPALEEAPTALAPPAPELPSPPLTPVPAQTPATATATEAAGYEAQVLALIERAKRYPNSREARQTRPQGTSRIWLELSRDGQLHAAGLIESSGSNLLDSQSLGTVRGLSFPAFPPTAFTGQDTHRFIVNIKYELRTD